VEVLVVVPKVSQMTNIIYMVDSVDMRELIAVPAQRERESERASGASRRECFRDVLYSASYLFVCVLQHCHFDCDRIPDHYSAFYTIVPYRTVFLKIMGNFLKVIYCCTLKVLMRFFLTYLNF
jgi:hypothetical protein